MGRNGVARTGTHPIKHVVLGKRTVKDGECAVFWSLGGKAREVEGPRRLRLFCTTVKFLDRYSASQRQYLRIQHKSGVVEHVLGPKTIFLNPVLHQSIEVLDSVLLSEGTAAVVYRQEAHGIPATKAGPGAVVGAWVTSRVLHGPALFTPNSTEWLHEFCETLPGASKSRGKVLSLLREQRSVQLQGVPARDGTAKVQLMLEYQVDDVDRLIHSSADPLRDMDNCLRTDLVNLAFGTTLQELKDSTVKLGDLAAYPSLTACAATLGVRLHQVIVHKVEANADPSKIAADQQRVELALKEDALEHRRTHQLKERSLQADEAASECRLADMRWQAELARLDAQHAQSMRHLSEEMELRTAQLRTLADMGVPFQQLDITRILLAQAPDGSQPDQEGAGLPKADQASSARAARATKDTPADKKEGGARCRSSHRTTAGADGEA